MGTIRAVLEHERTILQKIALKGRHESLCTEAVGPLKIGAD